MLNMAICLVAQAKELRVAGIFSNDMVLQRECSVPVWGKAQAGKEVVITTSWNDSCYKVSPAPEGNWKVNILTPKASATAYEIRIVCGKEAIVLNNVLIGDVWLCSGQSNMSMPLKGYYCQPVCGSNEAILNSVGKQIRFINIAAKGAYKPQEDFRGEWKKASLEDTGDCSAVAWFFADFINKHVGIPIGIINASYGGSSVEAWMDAQACRQFKDIPVPGASDEPVPNEANTPTALFNAMIHPIVGYAIKGMLWYQGESNIFNVPRYAHSVASMVAQYRKRWNRGDFPFYYVQIAPYEYKCWNFFTPQWPEISAYQREAQRMCMKLIPHSAMAVLLDAGEEYVIHPSRKEEVGQRLGLLALSKTYGFKGFEAESPEYEKLEIEGNKAIVHFTKQYNGITSYGKPLELFEIAGDNKVFQKAEAYIDENNGTVVCTSKWVEKPVAVRYAFRNYVKGELFGTGGLPVSSFKTDNDSGRAYYISRKGSPKNDGSIRKPFAALDSVVLSKLNAGDTVYFMGGERFDTSLYIHSLRAGTRENPIVISSWGNAKATIASGNKTGLLVYDSEYIKIENLHFVGSGRKKGNTKEGLCLSNSRCMDVADVEIEGYQKSGLEIYCCSQVVAERVYAHDNGYAGIQVSGESGRKDAAYDVLISHCKAVNNPGDPTNMDNHSGNGIVVGRCKKVTIEYCVATNNGWDMPRIGNGPVGIWAFEADSILIQYCISYRNKTSKGGQDGGGYDFDGGVTNSTIQYCLSYENEGAGYSLFQYKGASLWYNNVVRYCISENDGNVSNGMGGIFVWNNSEDPEELKDCYIYNNTIYNERGGAMCFEKKSNNKNFFYYNNIFVGRDDLNKEAPVSGHFIGNNWFSLLSGTGFNMGGTLNFEQWAEATGQELWKGKIVGLNVKPIFKRPGKTVLTDPILLHEYDAYCLAEDSPLRYKGLDLKKEFGIRMPDKDFNGCMPATYTMGACR